MTSRERVIKAINFQEPDRVPVDFGGMRSTGITPGAYAALTRYLGFELPPPKVYDPVQILAEIEEPILQRLGIDVIPLDWERIAFNIPNRDWKPWQLFDGTPVQVPGNFNPVMTTDGAWEIVIGGKTVARMPRGSHYFDILADPYQRRKPEDFTWPAHRDDELEYMRERSRWLYDNTDYAILGAIFGTVFMTCFPSGFDEWLCDMLIDPDYVQAVLDQIVTNTIVDIRRYHEAVEDRVIAVLFADDLGTQRSEFIRPDVFADVVAPHYKRICTWVHENTPYKVFLHSCGSIYHLIEILIDCGIDILNPIQTAAANMDPVCLQQEFGGRIVFWGGGCDTQHTLSFGTPADVEKQVQERVQIFAPGGGFVFTQEHNVQDGVPPENVVTMFDTVQRIGKYPIRPA